MHATVTAQRPNCVALSVFAALVVLVMAWSGYAPTERFTWWLEIAPVLIFAPIIIVTYPRFQLTTLSYGLIAIHCCVLAIGGKYTYAQVPYFDVVGSWFHSGRNRYDGVGHFMQGFVPAMITRELLLRTSPLQRGKWLVAIIFLSCMGISALYELVEWLVGATTGPSAEAFLGMQGDPFDTQKDMAMCGLGAITALATLSKLQDRELRV